MNNKGSALDNLGRFKEAISCYNKALVIDPNFKLALNNKGNTLYYLKRFQEALDCYERALKMDPAFKQAQYNKLELLRILKNQQSEGSSKDKMTLSVSSGK